MTPHTEGVTTSYAATMYNKQTETRNKERVSILKLGLVDDKQKENSWTETSGMFKAKTTMWKNAKTWVETERVLQCNLDVHCMGPFSFAHFCGSSVFSFPAECLLRSHRVGAQFLYRVGRSKGVGIFPGILASCIVSYTPACHVCHEKNRKLLWRVARGSKSDWRRWHLK